jgi:hypothetical protein
MENAATGTASAAAASNDRSIKRIQGLAADPARRANAAAATTATATATATDANSGANAISTLTPSADDLEFYLAVETIYHGDRAAFLTTMHRVAMFVTIVLGSAVVGGIGFAFANGLALAAIGAAEITFDPSGRASQHRDCRRRYLELAARLALCRTDSAACATLFQSFIAIGHDDPPEYRAAKLIAHNKAILSLGREAKPEPVPLRKRALAHLWRGE